MRIAIFTAVTALFLCLAVQPLHARQRQMEQPQPPPRQATMKIWGSSSITLNKVCAANQCKLCRDRVAMNQCGDPKLHLIYMETDTYLPLSWVKTIHFRKKGAPNPNFAAANITLTNGKCIDTLIMVREEMLPLIICGENDLGTISCLPIYKVKTITFK